MKHEETIKKVKQIITGYYKHHNTMSATLVQNMKDELVSCLFFLADQAALVKTTYNDSRYTRKIEIGRAAQEYKNDKSNAEAERLATLDNEGLYKIELDNESLAYRLDNLIRQGNKVVDSMQQRISLLKIEMNHSQNQQG